MSTRRRGRAALGALSCAVALACAAGCSANEKEPQAPGDTRIVGKDWQVMAIYTAPGEAADIPTTLKEVPQLSFGESSLVGTTGCSRLVAHTSFHSREEERAQNIRDGDVLRFESVTYSEPAQDCKGAAGWADARMRTLIRDGSEFSYRLNSNNQLILTLLSGAVDSPTIRLVSL